MLKLRVCLFSVECECVCSKISTRELLTSSLLLSLGHAQESHTTSPVGCAGWRTSWPFVRRSMVRKVHIAGTATENVIDTFSYTASPFVGSKDKPSPYIEQPAARGFCGLPARSVLCPAPCLSSPVAPRPDSRKRSAQVAWEAAGDR
jgi:hypothetical protein